MIDICRSVCPHQPQIKAENGRQDSMGRSWGGLQRSRLMSAKALISVEKRLHPWHGRSPRLTPSSARLIVSPSERAGLFFSKVRGRISSGKLGSCFLMGLHLSTAQAAARATVLMIRREACLNSPLFLPAVRSSPGYCIFMSSVC